MGKLQPGSGKKSKADAMDEIKEHTLLQSILLHLVPGILIGAFYYASVQPIRNLGFPSIAALNLAGLVVLAPVELGVMFAESKRSGKKGLGAVVLYRQPISWKQYLLWIPVILVSSGLVLALLAPASAYLETFFSWIPQSLRLDPGLSGEYSKPALIATYLSSFLMVSLAAPAIEEFYFRGFLLPRMPRLNGWAPLVHSALFALYHTWTPWMAIARTLAVLPLICIVRWKRNLYLGISAHCLLNSIDIFIGVAFILTMP